MTCSEKREPKGSASSSTERKKCGRCGQPIKADPISNTWFHTVAARRPCTSPTPEEPECQHANKRHTGSLYDGPGGRKSWLYYMCPDCKLKWREEEAEEPRCEGCGHEPHIRRCIKVTKPDADVTSHCGCALLAPLPVVEEPPLTPEEEEQAPEDEPRCTCGETACESELCDCDSAPCPVDHAREEEEALPPDEGLDCVCDHAKNVHEDDVGCLDQECGCPAYRTEPDFEFPPQPDRRPPYAVSYSVQGHLFEVALPGDASVRAVDGALVIQHHLGPVLGIVQVLPVINEEQG